MKEFIVNMMERIFIDFYDEVGEMDSLCCLKGFRYDGNNLPEYSDENIRRLYLLRYLPAYLVEYFLIYKKILKSNHIKKAFNIISIGSGCGLDYYGAHFAVKFFGLDKKHIRYTGLDAIDWEYKKKLRNNKIYFVNEDINEWEELDEDGYNIIIFSKSIGEFDIKTFSNIKNIFKFTSFSEDRICLVCSLREQRKSFDIDRFEEITKIMKDEHAFKTEDDPRIFYYYKDRQWLGHLCGDFNYPDHIKDFITSLSQKCPNFKKNGNKSCEPDCSDILDRYPILTDSYINYQFVRLTRT